MVVVIVRKRFPMKRLIDFEILKANCGHKTALGNNEEVVMSNCPQCGEETETLHEGYCEECRDERQRALNEHNASFDFWEKCTDAERSFYFGIF